MTEPRFVPVVAHGLSGAGATLMSDFIMTPFDVVKQRIQLQGKHFTGPLHAVRQVYASEGLFAFYRSLPTTLLMNIPYALVQV